MLRIQAWSLDAVLQSEPEFHSIALQASQKLLQVSDVQEAVSMALQVRRRSARTLLRAYRPHAV